MEPEHHEKPLDHEEAEDDEEAQDEEGKLANLPCVEKNMDGSTKVPCILHFDSIKGTHADAGIEETIRRYLFDHWMVKEGVNEQEKERIENNFLSLKFSSLELPMQENSYDCGIFLLHYVEKFIELTSNRTTDFMEQLDQNWFVSSDVSLKKRGDIRTLIYQLHDDAVKETQPADENVQTKASFSSLNVSPESQGSPRRKAPRLSSTISPMQLNFSEARFSSPSVTHEAEESPCQEARFSSPSVTLEAQESPCRELRNCDPETPQDNPCRELSICDLECRDGPRRLRRNWRTILPAREMPLRSKKGVKAKKYTPADYETRKEKK